jgi:hypothetical protein
VAPLSRKRALVWFTLAAIAAGLAASVPGSASGLVTTSGGAFTISGTLGGMHPGVTTNLSLTVSNPQSSPLYLQSVSASLVSAVYTGTSTPAPTACAGYLSPALPHTWTAWSGPTTIPAATGASSPGSAVVTVPLSFTDSGTNQNSCENVTFNLSYAGSAYYSDPTTTVLAATPNPANVGAPVTLTATVSPTYSGTAPTGTVTFAGPSGTLAGSPVTLAPVSGTTNAAASITLSTLPAGSDAITATYTPTGTGPGGGPNFLGSSGATNETVEAACTTPPTSGAGTVITGTYNGNYTVASGKSVWLNGGTITGNVTVNAGGQFSATGGTLDGNLTASGASALQGTTVDGNATSTNAAMSLGYGTSVHGNVSASGSGPACLNVVAVGGNVTLQSMTGTATSTVCGTPAAGNITVQSNSAPVQIGGSGTCAPNTTSGNLTVQSNSGKVTIGASGYGNTAGGNIVVQSNTGGGTLAGNTVTSGNCTLASDSPGIVGSGNTVPTHDTNTCNRTA